jgi:hypothetical protein
VRGRRGEQRGQAGQAQVRRPPEHGHQPSPHGPAEARPRGGGGLHARRLVLPPPFLSIPAHGQGALRRRRSAGRCGAAAVLFKWLEASCVVLFGWFDTLFGLDGGDDVMAV